MILELNDFGTVTELNVSKMVFVSIVSCSFLMVKPLRQ